VIIGTDWLNKEECQIDFGEKALRVRNTKCTFVRMESKSGKEHDMFVISDRNFEYVNALSQVFEKEILELTAQFSTLFSDEPGRTNVYIHKIRLSDDKPFKPRSYPIPWCHKEKVKNKIEEMIEWGVIRRSETPYISPLVPIIKKDGTVRVCLDAQALNKKIDMDYECPLPAEHLLYRVDRSLYFSTLDLTSSFWQIPLDKNSTKYCGFLFDNQVYEFLVMPFGLKTAVAGMSRCINLIFRDCTDFVSCYIDDILVTSSSKVEHYEHLKIVFEKLTGAGMTVNVSKCKFFREEIPFLGHVLTGDGVKIDPTKLESLKLFPRPINIKTLRGFLGICNYHRRFCPKYSKTLQPLYQLLKKGVKWKWDDLPAIATSLASVSI